MRTDPTVTMIAVVIVNARDPAANASRGFILVASVSKRRASLSVSSTMKIVEAMVKNAATRAV